jgi:signal transduction histidine kinase
LDEDLPEADKKRFLDIIIQETNRMTRLIDQVLDLERLDSGRQELNLEKTAIRILILQSAESMIQVFKEKNIDFTIDIEFEELQLLVDEDRIKQVILNLLSNASKFAKNKVMLKTYLKDHDLYIEVLDDGKGVPEEEAPFIFEKFFQAKNQTSKKPVGSGLGLAISKKIIEYHGGKIGVLQKSGMTCFEIRLPLQLEHNFITQSNHNYE